MGLLAAKTPSVCDDSHNVLRGAIQILSSTKQPKPKRGELGIMKTILLAGIAAVLLATSAALPRRPALPGDQFQLAANDAVVVQKPAQESGAVVQTQLIAGKAIMAPVAKGEGWM